MRTLPALLLIALATDASAQSYKSIKDWVGACDNTRQCVALGLSKEEAENYAVLRMDRGGAAGDGIERIRLRVNHELSRELNWVIDADDQLLLELGDANLQPSEEGSGLDIVLSGADEISKLLGALRTASSLTVIGDGGAVGSISLSGASAVMLWIDEKQLRLGTRTALVRKGDQDPASIPPPPAPPRKPAAVGAAHELPATQAQAVGARVRATLAADTCEELSEDAPMTDAAWELADGRTLVQLACFSGAYNFGSNWYLLPRTGAPVALSFPSPAEGTGKLEQAGELINASFDPDSGQVSSFNKGRGPGDCGSNGVWAWDGSQFALLSFSLMSDCRGVAPELWPVLWRSAG